jgi:hypothetical protein
VLRVYTVNTKGIYIVWFNGKLGDSIFHIEVDIV